MLRNIHRYGSRILITIFFSSLLSTPSYRKSNEDEIATLDKNIKDAKDNQGEVEVADAQLKRANYYNQIGDKTKALQLYSEIPEKPLSTGQKIDMNMVITRLGFFSNDMKLIQKKVTLAKTLNEAGGDWDRRNRLKVYEGLFNILQRNFTGASNLLLDSIATFTATEIIDYNQFIFLTVLVCILKLNRPDLQKKIINSPDVISVINDIPYLYDLLHSFYDCHYADYFRALTLIYPSICRNRFLATHASYYLREMRIAGYNQFLESYKSINLLSMAKSFGVSTTFLDNELARFIAVGRLNAKIDAVSGIVETTRPDTKNAQYHAIIKQGDVLLNKVQKLSRVISI